MEHRNCGAYTHFLGPEFEYPDTAQGQVAEDKEHHTRLKPA